MKLIFSIFLSLISISSYAQITQNQEQRKAILEVKKKQLYVGSIGLTNTYPIKNSYALIIEQRDLRSNSIAVYFDFGQESGYFNVEFILDENGNKFHIFSIVDALNYMKELGWDYIDRNMIIKADGIFTTYLMENKADGVTPTIKKG